MSILDRALRVGEGKKFKQFEKHVARIDDFEPELELESDDELRERYDGAARARRQRRVARRPALRIVRAHARGRQAPPRPAPLRRPADRRHGAARRLDRRDEDRRGQDAHRRRCRSSSTRSPARASTSSRSTTTSPAATPLDEADLRHARPDARRSSSPTSATGTTSAPPTRPTSPTARTPSSASTTCATTSRPTLAEKSQRGHGFAIVDEVDNILIDEARTPLIISGQPRAGRRPLLQVREAGAAARAGQEARRAARPKSKAYVADFDYEFDEKHKTVAITERGRREGREVPRHRQPLPRRERPPRQPPRCRR